MTRTTMALAVTLGICEAMAMKLPLADEVAEKLAREKCHAKGDVERCDTFLDFTGRGSGIYWQVYNHDNGTTEFYTYDSQWEAKGVKVAN